MSRWCNTFNLVLRNFLNRGLREVGLNNWHVHDGWLLGSDSLLLPVTANILLVISSDLLQLFLLLLEASDEEEVGGEEDGGKEFDNLAAAFLVMVSSTMSTEVFAALGVLFLGLVSW